MFACSPGDLIDVLQLCDGNEDCEGGDDETTALCESESVYYVVVGHHYHLYLSLIVCLLPYYGGCSFTRECETSELDVNCNSCLEGFGERDPEADNCSGKIE